MYQILSTMGTLKRSKIGQDTFEIFRIMHSEIIFTKSHTREKTLLSW